jgi:uncharacterized protein YhjY with autotransporter beta-barrel domain
MRFPVVSIGPVRSISFLTGVFLASWATAGGHTLLKNANGNAFTMPFGSQVVGGSTTLLLDLTRDTTSTQLVERSFTVGDVTISGANSTDFVIVTNNCSGVSFAGQATETETCTVGVNFLPTASGAKQAVLNIAGSAGQSRDVNLTGVAGRIDQALDKDTVGLVNAQIETNKRMVRAQLSTINRRLERLHQMRPGTSDGMQAAIAAPTANEIFNGLKQANPVLPTRQEALNQDGQQRAGSNVALVRGLQSALATGEMNLSYNSQRTTSGENNWLPGDVGVWLAGTVRFGNRDASAGTDRMAFSTDGVTMGVDTRLGEGLMLGVGLGYAAGEAEVGRDGTTNDSTGRSVSAYGSYTPGGNTYFDGVVGFGNIEHRTRRLIAPLDITALGERESDQRFASMTASYEFETPGLLLSPYLRWDYLDDQLDAAADSGAGINNLSYAAQSVSSQQLALGFRAETLRRVQSGWAQTRLRLEYKNSSDRNQVAEVGYSDMPVSEAVGIAMLDTLDDALLLGVGTDIALYNGIKLGFDYELTQYGGSEYEQAVSFWLAKTLGESSDLSKLSYQPTKDAFGLPLSVQVGYNYDDNVNRAISEDSRLVDDVYVVNVGSGTTVSVSDHTQLVLRGSLEAASHMRFEGLNKRSLGVQAEYHYKTSGRFDALTYGLLTGVTFESFDSELRSGERYQVGVNVRQAYTDRLYWFVQLAHHQNNAENEVFDAKFNALKVSADFALSSNGALYLTGEYRDGDELSSFTGAPYPGADAVLDDVFFATSFARYDAKTLIWSLGYNLPLGANDSIDFSLRRVKSTPQLPPLEGYDVSAYVTNQFSLFYLMKI